MLNIKKKSQIIILLILIIAVGIKTNFFRNLTEVALHKFDDRIINKYGYCSGESIGYLLYLKKKYQIKDNPKIVNYIHTPQVNWVIINTKVINKNLEELIFLNYPGPETEIDLEKINNHLFEFKDVVFYSNKFDKIESIEITNDSKSFEKIKWKIDILTIDRYRNKKKIRTFDIKNLLDENKKNELNIFFENLNFTNEEKFYFVIKNKNISEFKNLQLKIVLKNKYILKNFQIIDGINNCYYVRQI
jgi:hypothetical protein